MALDEIPMVHFFSAGCGSVCRPLEHDRPRCTNDAGAPRKDLFDADGVRVIPLNESIDRVAWQKEVKPTTLIVVIAMKVLQEAVIILETVVFVITDDFKSVFNQLRLSRCEYSMTGAVHPPRAGEDRVTFAYDSVLGFGIKMASNVAQRFADFLVHIFRKALAPVVQRLAARFCAESTEFGSWWEHRQSLGEGMLQAVLCCMFMYCDDPCLLCVGPDITHEALKVWT